MPPCTPHPSTHVSVAQRTSFTEEALTICPKAKGRQKSSSYAPQQERVSEGEDLAAFMANMLDGIKHKTERRRSMRRASAATLSSTGGHCTRRRGPSL